VCEVTVKTLKNAVLYTHAHVQSTVTFNAHPLQWVGQGSVLHEDYQGRGPVYDISEPNAK
jgi:hypothetical protein